MNSYECHLIYFDLKELCSTFIFWPHYKATFIYQRAIGMFKNIKIFWIKLDLTELSIDFDIWEVEFCSKLMLSFHLDLHPILWWPVVFNRHYWPNRIFNFEIDFRKVSENLDSSRTTNRFRHKSNSCRSSTT